MEKPVRSTYSYADFHDWREAGTLALTPRFQRRLVWSNAARSYFIDTLLRGFPVPPIYLRQIQDPAKRRAVREVVDGQQRVSTLLAFIDGDFSLSRTLDAPWAGKTFAKLDDPQQRAVTDYGFICEVMLGVSDAEVLEVFSRLNTYSVKLNAQELRNGKFFGYFKQTAYRLAFEHVEFWRRNNIFSDASISRMLEVELTSELLIAIMAGLQDKKQSIDSFYRNHDDDFPDREKVAGVFRDTVNGISETFGSSLRETLFTGVPLFYSLFTVVLHRQAGVPGVTLPTPARRLTDADRAGLRQAVSELSDVLEGWRRKEPVSARHQHFVNASTTQTDNIGPRLQRLSVLYERAFGG